MPSVHPSPASILRAGIRGIALDVRDLLKHQSILQNSLYTTLDYTSHMERLMKNATIILVVSLLAACAKSPSSIAPASVDSGEYSHLTCSQMTRELISVSDKLRQAEADQNAAQTKDAVTVFFFLIPLSSLSGDAEGLVAQYKGEKLALERAIAKNQC